MCLLPESKLPYVECMGFTSFHAWQFMIKTFLVYRVESSQIPCLMMCLALNIGSMKSPLKATLCLRCRMVSGFNRALMFWGNLACWRVLLCTCLWTLQTFNSLDDMSWQAVYRKVSNIRRTKYQNSNVSRLGLQLSLRNILKPSVKWRMKM